MRQKSKISTFLYSYLLPPTYYLLFSILFLFSSSLSAAVLTVKQDGTGDYTTIQQAIDAAAINDTVLVWPGTYYENLHINGKPLTLASLYLTTGERQYVYQTIIDGSTVKNSVVVADNLPASSFFTIYGFSIQNGDAKHNETNYPLEYSGWGGGILLYHADAKIIGCNIENNLAYFDGGGIKAMYSSLFLSSSTIRNNTSGFRGGGLWFHGGESLNFDTIMLNSIYFNHSISGNDLFKHYSYDMNYFRVDTATITEDHGYCFLNSDDHGLSVDNITLDANHGLVEQVAADVYVGIDGDNTNSGIIPEKPLRNIWYAMTKIKSDSNTQRVIHVMPGIYSPSVNGEIYPISGRSNITLKGVNQHSCILDAEETWFHYSSNPGSSGLEIRNLTLINGNSINNMPFMFFSGSLYLVNGLSNLLVDSLFFKNNIGLSSSACRLLTKDTLTITNITAIQNYGGSTITCMYGSQARRRAVFARNINVSYNSYYGELNGNYGGRFTLSPVYTESLPLINKVANIQVCNNKVYDSWGGATHLECFLVNGRENMLSNITVAHNENENHLPGAYATWENMTSYVYNSVFYGNEHPSIVLAVEPPLQEPGVLYLDYSLIEQGEADIWNQQNFNILHYGVNNIEGNPLFTGTGEHPYQLQPTSPCIDAGTPMYQEGMEPPYIKNENGKHVLYFPNHDTLHLPATDLAGRARIQGGRIDMGAYEFGDVTPGIWQERPQYLGYPVKAIPNPMQQSTSIEFTLLAEGHLRLLVHNLEGQLMNTLIDAQTTAGNFRLRWHADDSQQRKLPKGYYLVSVVLNGQVLDTVKVQKM